MTTLTIATWWNFSTSPNPLLLLLLLLILLLLLLLVLPLLLLLLLHTATATTTVLLSFRSSTKYFCFYSSVPSLLLFSYSTCSCSFSSSFLSSSFFPFSVSPVFSSLSSSGLLLFLLKLSAPPPHPTPHCSSLPPPPPSHSPPFFCDIWSEVAKELQKKKSLISVLFYLPPHFQDYEFRVRWPAIRLLTCLLSYQASQVQQYVLGSPMGVSKMMDLLSDSREVIRNDVSYGHKCVIF